MDDRRDLLSRMKKLKKLGHRLTGRNRKPDGVGTGPSGEGADPAGSPLHQVPAGENHGQEVAEPTQTERLSFLNFFCTVRAANIGLPGDRVP